LFNFTSSNQTAIIQNVQKIVPSSDINVNVLTFNEQVGTQSGCSNPDGGFALILSLDSCVQQVQSGVYDRNTNTDSGAGTGTTNTKTNTNDNANNLSNDKPKMTALIIVCTIIAAIVIIVSFVVNVPFCRNAIFPHR